VDLPYDAPPLRDYLQEFYRPYPRCDFAVLDGKRYRLADCASCGCLYQVEAPSPDYLSTFYQEGLYGGDAPLPAAVQPYEFEHAARELAMVVRFVEAQGVEPRVLDFGGGNGDWCRLAATAHLDVSSSDLSSHAFPSLEAAGIRCYSPSKLPRERFHFVHTEQVFEHVVDPLPVARGLWESLLPHGVLQIGVPYDPTVREKLRQPDWRAPKHTSRSLNAVAPIEHLNHFEPRSLDALARRAGFAPLNVDGWTLRDPSAAKERRTLRQWIARSLRTRLGEVHHPAHRLAQTRFYRKPGSATTPS
jgi:SAM-dependent methyltransferase